MSDDLDWADEAAAALEGAPRSAIAGALRAARQDGAASAKAFPIPTFAPGDVCSGCSAVAHYASAGQIRFFHAPHCTVDTRSAESRAAVAEIVAEASERLGTGHEYAGRTCHKCGVDHADEWARKPCPGRSRVPGSSCCWRGAFSRAECASRGGPDDCAMHKEP